MPMSSASNNAAGKEETFSARLRWYRQRRSLRTSLDDIWKNRRHLCKRCFAHCIIAIQLASQRGSQKHSSGCRFLHTLPLGEEVSKCLKGKRRCGPSEMAENKTNNVIIDRVVHGAR